MKKNVIIVDDDVSILEALKQLLSEEDYAIEVSNDPQSLFVQAENKAADLIFIDVHLTKANGIEISKELKENEYTKDTVIILMTADIHIEEKTKQAKADDYLRKPFDIGDIKYLITKYLQ